MLCSEGAAGLVFLTLKDVEHRNGRVFDPAHFE